MRDYGDTPNHKLKVLVTYDKGTIPDVVCEVFLPRKVADPFKLLLKPTEEQSKITGEIFAFSIEGAIIGDNGEVETRISGKTIYNLRHSTMLWGTDLSETTLTAEPADLTISHLRSDPQDENMTKGNFWFTPSIIIPVSKCLIRSYTGTTELTGSHNFTFTLENGLQLAFDHHYRYLSKEDGATESFPELVAEFELSPCTSMDLTMSALDDFLLLTSFAARQRCVCLGWETFDRSTHTTFYRRDVSIPKNSRKHTFNDTLITLMDYPKFIDIAYKNFIKRGDRDMLRQALYRSLGRFNSTTESIFLTLYASLETLVLLYRRNNRMEYVFEKEDWLMVKGDIKSAIKSHQVLANDKNRRRLLYDKLEELNRIAFPAAFNEFCAYYKIILEDLWPVVDRSAGISLSDIRNRLIHGDMFSPIEERSLFAATEHLRWTVERSLLAILGWSCEESNVSEGYLSRNLYMHKQWHDSRMILRNA